MGDGCWMCKKWEEHYNSDHFDDSNLRFMKVMAADFTQKMEFPQKILKNFRVELIDVVALEAPGGKSWEIGLCKQEEHFLFKGGWKKFVEENEIKEDYILLFEYAGDSRFLVRIFDKTGCGRAASNGAGDDAGAKQKKNAVVRTRQNFQNVDPSRSACKDHPLLHGEADDAISDSAARFAEDEKCGMVKANDEAEKYVKNSQDTLKILELRFASKVSHCFFVKVIVQTNISAFPFMAIPAKFVKKHILQKPNGITVRNERGEKWFVKCCRSCSSWGFSGKSLCKLVEENEIQKGDACVFELKEIMGTTVAMEMRVVRAQQVSSILKNSYF